MSADDMPFIVRNAVEKGLVRLDELENCFDCAVAPGQPHVPGCDIERCSVCHLQRLGCSCAAHNPDLARWTGLWPGEIECRERGWMIGPGMPDLNRWIMSLVTGKDPGPNAGHKPKPPEEPAP